MNTVTKQLILMVGPTILKSLLNSIFEEKQLVEYRDKLIDYARRQADTTGSGIDDTVVEAMVGFVMDPKNYIEFTMDVISLCKQYIMQTTTDWDDFLLMPILTRIEQLGTGEAE